MPDTLSEQKKEEIVGKIDPTKSQCDCCKKYFDLLEIESVLSACADSHFTTIVHNLGIFEICEPCFIILRDVYNGGVDRVQTQIKRTDGNYPFQNVEVTDLILELKNWFEKIQSDCGI